MNDFVVNEFVIEWLRGDTIACITAPSRSALKSKLVKLANEYPEECDYLENMDGSVVGHVPVKYIKVSHPRKMSEDTKQKLVSNLQSVGKKND